MTMVEKFLELLKKLGFDITGKEDQLKTEIENSFKDNDGKVDLSKIDTSKMDESTKALVSALKDTISAQSNQMKNLEGLISKEQTEREKAVKLQEEQVKRNREAKVTEAVQKLLTDKKITEAQKDAWTKLYQADFESAAKTAEALPAITTGAGKVDPPTGTDNNTGIKPTGNKILDNILVHNQSAPVDVANAKIGE